MDFDPFRSQEISNAQSSDIAGGIRSVTGPVEQQRLMTAQEDENAKKPANVSPWLSHAIQRVAAGQLDGKHAGELIKAHQNGALTDDHMAAIFGPAQGAQGQPQGAPQQGAPPAQSPQPQQAQPGGGGIAEAAQPPPSPPPPSVETQLTKGDLAWINSGGLQKVLTETPDQKAQRQYYELMIRGETARQVEAEKSLRAREVTEKKTESAERVEASKSASKIRAREIGAKAQVDAAIIRANASIKAMEKRSQTDPTMKGYLDEMKSVRSSLSNLMSSGAENLGPNASQQVKDLLARQSELEDRIKSYKPSGKVETPTSVTPQAAQPNVQEQKVINGVKYHKIDGVWHKD